MPKDTFSVHGTVIEDRCAAGTNPLPLTTPIGKPSYVQSMKTKKAGRKRIKGRDLHHCT